MTAQKRAVPLSDFLSRHFVEQFGHMQPVITHPERKALREQGLNGGSMFQLYLDENDDYGTPEVMAPEEFDKYVKDNKLRVVYRGDADIEDGDYELSAVDMQKNFLYDRKYYVGNGMFGDGKYFGDERTAKSYAVTGYYVEGQGAVMRMALKPGAKTIGHERLKRELAEEYPEHALRESLLSVYARSKGYDAITVGIGSDAFVCVINRDAVVASSEIRRVRDYDYI